MKEHTHAIKKLHTHKNTLYTLVMILLIFQIVIFFVLSAKMTQMINQQQILSRVHAQSLNDLRGETRYNIDEIARAVTQQREELQLQNNNFTGQIEQLRTQGDFSAVIDTTIKSVVSVGTDIFSGTGFAVNLGGYIVTNEHVIRNARYIRVLTYEGVVYPATLVGADNRSDVAVLRIETNLPGLELINSTSVSIGEDVIAIGNPLGLSFSVTEGIVSAVGREGPHGPDSYIQTDVTLNPGNSGGPLINHDGKVIGINNFKIGDAEGLGFALKSEVVHDVIKSIQSNASALHA